MGVIGTAEGLRLLRGRVGEGEVGDWSGDDGEVCGDGASLEFRKNGSGIRDLSGG